MKLTVKAMLFVFCWAFCWTILAQAQVLNFSHIIGALQENRTPDNIFQACNAVV
jgi:hypothetical protein